MNRDCPSATQGQAYACTLTATGGTGPYTFSVVSSDAYAPLPDRMSLDGSSGVISSALVGGQGTYGVQLRVADSASHTATADVYFAIAGSNAYLASIFPPASIFHHRMDAASTGLPVDTSPSTPPRRHLPVDTSPSTPPRRHLTGGADPRRPSSSPGSGTTGSSCATTAPPAASSARRTPAGTTRTSDA